MASKHRPPRKGRGGNCYYASEALYHILGGKKAGWKPMHVVVTSTQSERCGHWYLQHRNGLILDVSQLQFGKNWYKKPDYTKGRGKGFLTKNPSHLAKYLIEVLTWQNG